MAQQLRRLQQPPLLLPLHVLPVARVLLPGHLLLSALLCCSFSRDSRFVRNRLIRTDPRHARAQLRQKRLCPSPGLFRMHSHAEQLAKTPYIRILSANFVLTAVVTIAVGAFVLLYVLLDSTPSFISTVTSGSSPRPRRRLSFRACPRDAWWYAGMLVLCCS